MSLQKVFVANRGEIAVRVIRACQALGMANYGKIVNVSSGTALKGSASRSTT